MGATANEASLTGLVGLGLIDKNRVNIEWINMNPHQLELFYHVAKSKGVSRAVRQMPYGIQQPSISAQVNALERDLGVTLYERRPFKLTPSGEELFKFVEPFFGRILSFGKNFRGPRGSELAHRRSCFGIIFPR